MVITIKVENLAEATHDCDKNTRAHGQYNSSIQLWPLPYFFCENQEE
jgi:hypothetical protein